MSFHGVEMLLVIVGVQWELQALAHRGEGSEKTRGRNVQEEVLPYERSSTTFAYNTLFDTGYKALESSWWLFRSTVLVSMNTHEHRLVVVTSRARYK